MTQPCELQGEMQTWLFYPLNFLPSRSAPLFVTPEMEKHNLASKYLCSFPEASDLPVQLDSQLPGRATSQSLSPACFYIINKQEHCFPLAVSFPGIVQTPEHPSTTCACFAGWRTVYTWKGGRRAFLGGHTYKGLLFFSSSESELWWWIQLLSPFRVVRTFICLMILLRSSSVGGMTPPSRGKGRREEMMGC